MQNQYLSESKKNTKKITSPTVFAFLIMTSLCFFLIFVMVSNRSNVERLTMERLILEKSIKIDNVISKLLYKTQMLSSLVLQSNIKEVNFEQIAATIIDDPAILNVLIAPNGIVSSVYPSKGNEAVIGLDFFSEGAGNKEAIMAKDTGQLVLGGPFDAIQGGQILVGRLPVYIDANGTKDFWGLVSVTLKYPQALDGAGLNELKIQGFAYEIWRINPDTKEKQIIDSSGHKYNKNTNYTERQISIQNADWYFRILPVRAWYEFPETWISIFIGICVSLLVAYVVQSNHDLRELKNKLETLSHTDPLTGLYNRRYFMDTAIKHLDRVTRMNSESFILVMDLDYFKKINDSHGHQSGDMVLKEISMRIARILRSYDLFSRYGGEEFVILATEIDQPSAMRLAERIRLEIAETPMDIKNASINVTISIGVAPAAPKNKLETAIAFADAALYKAKKEGRNKSVFYEGIDL